MSSSTLFEQPEIFDEAYDDLVRHVAVAPSDDALEGEWENWGRNFLGLMVRHNTL
jgi:hypothetical protein